ncbi:F-box/kelch-repeat protein [Citrus sinensis]|uniref:F-box/kelch-repeat protein n=1 Tax=Citrus sinensis TaxID=2711 RepID=A0ACB8JJS8_CITSI|nr:F-box/kelch-repeat protein [Citrus sinensis]
MGQAFQLQQDQAPSPLLFFLGEFSGETKNAIYDPLKKAFSVVDFPELSFQIQCLASGQGWLLLLSRRTTSLFFFDPLTRRRIDLPYRSSVFNAATFSTAPTSPSCTVLAIERDPYYGKFNFDVLRVGKEKSWTRHSYSVGSGGRISSFDTKNWEYRVLSWKHFREAGGRFLVEHNGEIFAVKKGSNGIPEKVYKIKFGDDFIAHEAATWEEVKDLRDATLFLGPHGACACSGLDKDLQNTIFFNEGVECMDVVKFDAREFSSLHAPVWI